MSAFIAKKAIRLLVENDKNIKDANVLLMGLTFKENCPDIRNTMVIDIIAELKDFGCQVDVYDPWVDKEEERKTYKYGLIDNPFEADKKYAVIIVAVAHQQFVELKESDYASISEGKPIVNDVKGIVQKPS